jgi:hypothetical protein
MKRFVFHMVLMVSAIPNASAANPLDVFGDVVVRYENESQHNNLADRERLRLIARLGLKGEFNDTWAAQVRLSTGLKNRQNVPAITIARFNTQPQPDSDVYIERAFITGNFSKTQLFLGKIPWQTQQVTDVFWDRNLNPIGAQVNYQFNAQHQLQLALLKPLDGNSDLIGLMHIIQWNMRYDFNNVTVAISPWFVDYQGQSGAVYASKDTDLDNRSIRLSASVHYKGYKLGVDVGQSLSNFSQFEQYSSQKTSVAMQLSKGKLAQEGDYAWHLRYLRVERFGVIDEFAQNATARFATSNLQGLDFRLRRQMSHNWWLGGRISDIKTIVGDSEQGVRIRIEGQYKF